MRYTAHGVDLEVWVELKHVPQGAGRLNEYDERFEGGDGHYRPGSCTSYLECVEGQAFAIVVRCHSVNRQDDLRIRFLVDGRYLGMKDMGAARRVVRREAVGVEHQGQLFDAEMTFAPMRKTDDVREVTMPAEMVNQLQKIQLEVLRGRLHVDMRQQDGPMGEGGATGWQPRTIHEKQFKLGTAVIPGNLRPREGNYGPRGRSVRFVPMEGHSAVCTFTWNYFTRDLLILKGTIEDKRPPTPPFERVAVGIKGEDVDELASDEEADGERVPVKQERTARAPRLGSKARPFRIDNEDSDDECVILEEQDRRKRLRVKTEVDLTQD